jgi:hypothetical protein
MYREQSCTQQTVWCIPPKIMTKSLVTFFLITFILVPSLSLSPPTFTFYPLRFLSNPSPSSSILIPAPTFPPLIYTPFILFWHRRRQWSQGNKKMKAGSEKEIRWKRGMWSKWGEEYNVWGQKLGSGGTESVQETLGIVPNKASNKNLQVFLSTLSMGNDQPVYTISFIQ